LRHATACGVRRLSHVGHRRFAASSGIRAPESELRHDPQAAATLTIRLLLLLLLAAAAGTIAGWRDRASL